MNIRKLTELSLLLGLSLILFTVEAAAPPIPVPGVKVGLSQLVTLFALFRYGWREAASLLLARIFLSAIFGGGMAALLFSLSGGMLSLLAMAIGKRFGGRIIPVSLTGAVFHNAGQLLAAVYVTGTWAVLAYGPVLFLAALLAGFFIGVIGRGILVRKLV